MPVRDAALLGAALIVAALLFRPAVRRRPGYRAMITPLASIIGSGFLVIAPLLATVMGRHALQAITAIVLFAYAVGGLIRYNIRFAEPLLRAPVPDPFLRRAETLSGSILFVAYIISVAFYVRLLSAFVLHPFGLEGTRAVPVLTTLILAGISLTGFRRGFGAMETMEVWAVNVKLAIITALLIGLVWFHLAPSVQWNGAPATHALTPGRTLALLGGMLLVVQGFEVSRFMHDEYDAAVRVRAMRDAQILSGLIYVAFIGLSVVLFGLVPMPRVDETAIIDYSRVVAPILPVMLIFAAVLSQFSAAIADSIGAGGLLAEASNHRLSVNRNYLLVGATSIALVWTVHIFGIITLASRAFAAYYFMQGVSALRVCWLRETGTRRWLRLSWTGLIALALLLIVLFAIPAG